MRMRKSKRTGQLSILSLFSFVNSAHLSRHSSNDTSSRKPFTIAQMKTNQSVPQISIRISFGFTLSTRIIKLRFRNDLEIGQISSTSGKPTCTSHTCAYLALGTEPQLFEPPADKGAQFLWSQHSYRVGVQGVAGLGAPG